MSKTDAHEAHYRRMSEAPVSGLVTRMAIPSIITMVISSVYNMADTFFVSRLNISASGAVGIVFSIMAIIQAVGFSLGMGSGSLVSRHLEAKEKEQADTVASAGFFSALAAGAAIATALSQCVSFFILLYIYLSGRSSIRLSLRRLPGNMRLLWQILVVGFPTLCRQGLASLASVATSRAVRPYGDAAIAAMSIISRIIHFQGSVVRGLSQGCQPVAGFNYGAKRYRRVYDATRFTVWAGTIFMLAVSAVFFLWTPDIMRLFCKGDLDVVRVGTLALRAYSFAAPMTGLVTAASMVLQSVGCSGSATALSCCRQGLFLFPILLILPGRIGLPGVQLAQPLADGLTFCTALPLYISFKRNMLKREDLEE